MRESGSLGEWEGKMGSMGFGGGRPELGAGFPS